MGQHGYDDQQSTYNFMQALRQQPALLAEVKAGLTELSKQADQDQPVEGALAREIEQVAQMVAGIHSDSETWYGMCRTDARNRRDGDRVDEPRKSPAVESRADVGAAVRDM